MYNLSLKLVKIFSLICFTQILFAQENSFQLIASIGKRSINEINVGFAIKTKKQNDLEFLLGYEFGADFLDRDCLVIVPRSDFIRVRSNIKGVNLRTSFFRRNKKFGLTNIIRYGNANNISLIECSGPTNRRSFDQELLDIGLLARYRSGYKKVINLFISMGFLVRTSEIRNFRRTIAYSYYSLSRDDRTTTTFMVLFNWGVQFNFNVKKKRF